MQITLNFSSEAVDVLERFIAAVGVAQTGGAQASQIAVTEEAVTEEAVTEETVTEETVTEESSKPKKATKNRDKQPDLSAIKSAIKESSLDKGRIMDLMKTKFAAEKVTDIPQERWSEFIVALGTAV